MFAQVGKSLVNSIILHNVALLVTVGETKFAFAFDFHLFSIYVAYFGILVHWRRQGYLNESVCFEAFGNLVDEFVHSSFP